ncbi:hypothetical protein DM44_1610 [Burkholderia cepacia]|jgi:hypothetical protein|nr:hypothetical protein DM42_1763 [Burkholderia cepacia]KGB95804.1 hypothetical protein DM44_1610 [Burkholderia cepacia]
MTQLNFGAVDRCSVRLNTVTLLGLILRVYRTN